MVGTSKQKSKTWLAWLGLMPFFLFGIAFEIIPVLTLARSSLTDQGVLTLKHFERALTPLFVESFRNSIQLSAATALLGVVFGTIVAYAIVTTRNRFVRDAITALADVTTNFGGAPLAFAFIVVLGSTGVVTLILKMIGINLYPTTFRIYSIQGLTVAYLYFQLPLMILLIIPSLLGLRREWREAAINLGASPAQYWLRVALPILAPALLGGFLLLFANAFGAYATAWTLTGPDVNLVTVQIAALVRGEVQLDPALADALAMLSLLVMTLCVAGYQWLGGRARKEAR
ncbi:MAG: ABC transporter permease subunit [Anaerolineales bacterium]|nr:ABC transporter permease subunit [Anaerolineales bacterium]